MRGTIGETFERLILLQIGAAAATRDRVEEVVERLIQQGRVQREEGRTVVDDVLNSARERSAGARSLVDASMQQGLRNAGLPTREDYEDLLFRVEQLEHRVRMLEDRPVVEHHPSERRPPEHRPPEHRPPEPPQAAHPPKGVSGPRDPRAGEPASGGSSGLRPPSQEPGPPADV